MSWRGTSVLVTGATGVVGASLCARLVAEGADVVAFVRDWDPRSELVRAGTIGACRVVQGALEDYAAVERAVSEHEVETVIHLGAQAIVGVALRSPLLTFESNIRGTYNLLEACRVHSALVKSVVVASSDKAYGDSDLLPYVEEMPLKGRHPYDVSKSCTDLIAHTYAHTYGLPVTIARCGNIYGGGDLNWSRIVPGTIRAVLEERAPMLRSNGTNLRDYIFVDDVVDAYLQLALRSREEGIRGEAFNFSPESRLSVLDMTAAVLRAMGRSDLQPVIQGGGKAEIQDQYLNSEKARTRLQWRPAHDLEAGLARTIPWYRDFLGARP
ncbi:NAD-dependent epimerase/dehydratase family protein [Geothrix sp. 21YS21S-4]|uniref:NAD-dependent epimerase/dehydratase family protein n=1 Tax=Geothrix sp. 21YS21S-4 TaxID=3068889 RepID=UPI0027B9789A|nr:NAD-dependent epimerase/dehydratase family protein [Geothrix sp. 21YS21S-4]